MIENNNLPSVSINSQYVKDLSFENPNGPASLIQQNKTPKIEVSLDLEASIVSENTFEVCLKINATAKTDENNLFVAELAYAGLFILENVPQEEKELILLIHCPTILFPFARRIIADVTRDGGFQPLMLDPIDFASLYHQKKASDSAIN